MTDEYIDILNKNGKPSGKIVLKSEAHRLGLYHGSVHIWFFTQDNELLFQKRATSKDTYPDLWDVSVAGHIGAGESKEKAAIREIEEEIGLHTTENDFQFIGTYLSEKTPRPDIFDNEFHHIFLAILTQPIASLRLQKEEVSAVRLLSARDFTSHLNDIHLSKKYVPHKRKYYDFVLSKIKDRLS